MRADRRGRFLRPGERASRRRGFEQIAVDTLPKNRAGASGYGSDFARRWLRICLRGFGRSFAGSGAQNSAGYVVPLPKSGRKHAHGFAGAGAGVEPENMRFAGIETGAGENSLVVREAK